ncbi:alpha/beta fold hydrolase [Pseudonocardia alni]|uniref:alpha/beta fold hydrolase n=1 Tax=Pseudonocardia alni TaxID=33907 RepID=UPI0033FBD732
MTSPTIDRRTVQLRGGSLPVHVQVAGSGPALVYLHPAGGLAWDGFLHKLADRYTVYAPELPGSSPENPEALDAVAELPDLVEVYVELLKELDLDRPAIVGQSFGGMLAAEIGAHSPDLVTQLVLLAPLGLWRDDAPVADLWNTPFEQLPALLFHDPAGPAATAFFTFPEDPALREQALAGVGQALKSSGKFVAPKPEKGLSGRLHRITAPTLVVWGREDALNPAVYAEGFRSGIPGSTVEVIPGSGHIVQVEKEAATLAVVSAFLK